MDDPTIVKFAQLSRVLFLDSESAGVKLLNTIRSFVMTGNCDSNADEDSVCGGVCPTCVGEDDDKQVEQIEEQNENQETPDNTISPDLLPAIQTHLTQRAKDLSLSIIKPDTFARKLREELISIVGPEAAITYHISAQFDSSTQQLNFQVARLSPKTAIKLSSDLDTATLQIAYTTVTPSGWRVSVGLNAAYTGDNSRNRFRLPPNETKIEFGVTLAR